MLRPEQPATERATQPEVLQTALIPVLAEIAKVIQRVLQLVSELRGQHDIEKLG
jgi:hypothetical protein